jgi:hypothetical protein
LVFRVRRRVNRVRLFAISTMLPRCMKTLAGALAALFKETAPASPPSASLPPGAPAKPSLAGPEADRAREALSHYNRAIEQLKYWTHCDPSSRSRVRTPPVVSPSPTHPSLSGPFPETSLLGRSASPIRYSAEQGNRIPSV